MAGESHTTTDHKTIQKWTEARGGKPATVKRTGDDEHPGVLRIDFPGGDEDSLEEISWNAFFEKFEESNLAFLYQEQTAGGEESRFFKLVSREGKAEDDKPKKSTSKKKESK